MTLPYLFPFLLFSEGKGCYCVLNFLTNISKNFRIILVFLFFL